VYNDQIKARAIFLATNLNTFLMFTPPPLLNRVNDFDFSHFSTFLPIFLAKSTPFRALATQKINAPESTFVDSGAQSQYAFL